MAAFQCKLIKIKENQVIWYSLPVEVIVVKFGASFQEEMNDLCGSRLF